MPGVVRFGARWCWCHDGNSFCIDADHAGLIKNLELKQRVREIEGSLADVDHIMVQLRLVDAQIQTMVQDNPKVENTEP